MSAKYDVAIVGGGPAGLVAAIEMSQRGFRTVVLDGREPPVDKACGEGVLPDAIQRLSRLGITVEPGDRAEFLGIQFSDNTSSFNGRFTSGVGWGVRRTVLHSLLHKRAEDSGADLLWGTAVRELRGNQVICRNCTVEARWIIGADGLHSQVRRWSGLDRYVWNRERVAFRQHFALQPPTEYVQVLWNELGQCYVTPVGRREISVAVICRGRHLPFEELLRSFPAMGDILPGAAATSALCGSLTASRKLWHIHTGHIALLGDASGSVDAITGEGICLAMQQAEALGDALVAGDLGLYRKKHAAILRRPSLMAGMLSTLSNHPQLRRRVFRAFSRDASLFESTLAFHIGEIALRDLSLAMPAKLAALLTRPSPVPPTA